MSLGASSRQTSATRGDGQLHCYPARWGWRSSLTGFEQESVKRRRAREGIEKRNEPPVRGRDWAVQVESQWSDRRNKQFSVLGDGDLAK